VLAGVNGSGKSTILRGMASAYVNGDISKGFPEEDFAALVRYGTSVVVEPLNRYGRFGSVEFKLAFETDQTEVPRLVAAYSPTVALRHISREQFSANHEGADQALSFGATVSNETVQRWIVDLFSRRAIARHGKQSVDKFDSALQNLNRTLASIYGEGAELDIDVELLEPRVKLFGRSLNFSQLPQGVAATLGWIVDFHRRAALFSKDWSMEGAVLLIDEVEAYLHPRWQRRILPALHAGLPGVQIIVASHSPFVIASCPDAKVHMLGLDEATGEASYRGSVPAPVGQSVHAILRDIFGVDSRFDVRTEQELEELNELQRQQADGALNSGQQHRLEALRESLSARSVELRFIVGTPVDDAVRANIEDRFLPKAKTPGKAPRRKANRTA
jgi:AAA domain, putative AbiEii toxin, Type IV TA system